jgi:hypothetical protein
MDLLRSITCHLFLGLPIGRIPIEKTKSYVKSIVEYFLLKPNEFYNEKQTNKTSKID